MKSMIFETHAHYDDPAFDEDRDELIRSFKENNIEYVINSGADFTGCVDSVALAKKYDHVLASLGIHPELAHELNEANYEYIREQAHTNSKVVAIGEIGLDYHTEGVDRALQREAFQKQIELAIECKLPIVVHSRDAAADTLEILKSYVGYKGFNLTGSIHCFSYSSEVARQLVDMGYLLGIGGVVTFNNAKNIVEVVENTPIENILLETDSPYLAPVPYRGKRNSALNIHYIAQKIASIKGISYDEVLEITNANAKRIFLPKKGR